MKDNMNESWKKVLNIRMKQKYNIKKIIDNIFDNFYELHGDRLINDDLSIIGGLAFLSGKAVTIIAQYKGETPKEKSLCNYGMTMPDGYRKALRLMKQAEKFDRPIICFIDTPGAYPGIQAEERGQAEAIAKNLYEMSKIKVPIISVIVGEGGSGGALALCVANKIVMFENAIFSVVSPEGCASILWRDSSLAPKAAERLKITAQDLMELGVIDFILKEDGLYTMCKQLKKMLITNLRDSDKYSNEELVKLRCEKIRNIGKIL